MPVYKHLLTVHAEALSRAWGLQLVHTIQEFLRGEGVPNHVAAPMPGRESEMVLMIQEADEVSGPGRSTGHCGGG